MTDANNLTLQENFPYEPGMKRFLLVGVFFAAAGYNRVKLVSTEDIGVFVGKALLDPENEIFLNKTLTLSGGEYDLDDLRLAYEKVQGFAPWFASWLPEYIVHTFPFDFKQMMLCEHYNCQAGYSSYTY